MKVLVIFSFFLLLHHSSGLKSLHSSQVGLAFGDDTPDVFKVFEAFTSLVLVSDPVNDTMLECFQVCRTDMRAEQGSAAYSWIFPKLGQTLQLDIYADEDNPGAFTFTTGDDPTVTSGRIRYSDYRTCLVLDNEYHGHQCLLIATPEFKDNVPQHCIDHFLRTCGGSARLRTGDHCNNIECE